MTIPLTPPVFARSATVEFSFPFDTPTLTITIRSPALGDVERISQTRGMLETRGGDLIAFRNSDWPEDNELALTFTGLSNTERVDLKDFIAGTLGQEFKYTDHLGQVWLAILTNPETEFVQDTGGDCATHTINLVLNVELTSWP